MIELLAYVPNRFTPAMNQELVKPFAVVDVNTTKSALFSDKNRSGGPNNAAQDHFL